MLLRRVHAYLAVFVAPSLLFFAITGAVQLFNLHEAHDGYQPPALIRGLAKLHKDQVFDQGLRSSSRPAGSSAEPADGRRPHAPRSDPAATLVLKWFFLFVTMAFCASTGIGLWLGLRAIHHRRLSWLLLSCGTAVPIILAILTGIS